MAPLENGEFQPSVWAGDKGRPADALMRALLYIVQQVGRPLSEADVRRMTAVPAAGLDEQSFLIKRLGLATPLFMMLVLNTVIGRDPPSTPSAMILLCLGMLAAYALDFALRVMRGRLSARTGAGLDTLMSAEVLHHLVQLPY